ncbi:universal stress protein [Halorarius litoreus]|uniref:universal stress protein n=1 Tax=Halorarius litoreus TaxID=2962676 RepID=UPI0020CD4E7E|nr:universal stress protein [Halorarius litoreus]
MYDRILVPVDDAETMTRVFEHAAEIAGPRDATVHVLHVVDKRAFLTLDDDMKDEVEAELDQQGETTVAAAADWFAEAGVAVETTCRSGDPADEILAFAADIEADLVVMGTRQVDYQQAMLGSVSRTVTANADAPVLTVDVAAP